MTITIDFGPQVEAQLLAIAKQNGIAPAEVVKKLVTGDLPSIQLESGISQRNMAAIALLQSWRHQDATDDPELIRQAEQELNEFKCNINANREISGERPVYC